MIDIFVSYARPDRAVAQRVAEALGEDGWNVFWDRNIEAGAEWSVEIQRALREARCVVVLWSAASKASFWVRGEATEAYEKNIYLPVSIDRVEPPRLFAHVQAESIDTQTQDAFADALGRLKAAVQSRIGQLPMYGNLERVAEGEPVTSAHLNIVHSCWRVDKQTRFGIMPFQIHLIIYGHRSALDRVDSVEYLLPGYPPGHDRQPGGPRDRLFELKELANGFSIAQALVSVRSQPPGHPRLVRLTRLINMSEAGPRLVDDFIRRNPR